MRPAVFLDRDGTMVHDVGYLSRLEDVRWFPWTVDAVRLLNRAGFLVMVATNQGGVGLGFTTESVVHQVHDAMAAHLIAGGARVDGWFYCPHHPRAIIEEFRVDCPCRKPRAGLIDQARAQFAIDPDRSFVVGDKGTDLGLAHAAGLPGILVRTGHGEAELARHGGRAPGAVFVAAELMEAVSWMLRQTPTGDEAV
jgi:D-glycero-D-manno-heptose 1,7-bisphosphate phosphatase